MSFGSGTNGRSLKFALIGSMAVLALLMVRAPQAQEAKRMAPSGGGDIARGAYIVNSVAMCPTCHTPHMSDGQLNRSQWLQGGPIVYLPAQPMPNWPLYEPRIGGTLPTSEANMITLLTTGNLDRWQRTARSHAQVPHEPRRRGSRHRVSEDR